MDWATLGVKIRFFSDVALFDARRGLLSFASSHFLRILSDGAPALFSKQCIFATINLMNKTMKCITFLLSIFVY